MKRREFLQNSALMVAGAAAFASGAAAVGHADQWSGKLKALDAHQAETLLKMARQLFPHDRLDESYYVNVVHDLDDEADTTPSTAKLIAAGVANLDHQMNTKFVSLSPDKQVITLKKVQDTPFFEKVRGTELVSLYNNHNVWEIIGYQGASYRFGGYLHHGFNDLDWLPNPPESASPKPT
jgi:hypothetical protein